MSKDKSDPDPHGVVAGTYGDSTHVAQIAVNAKGQILGTKNVPIAFPADGGSPPPGAVVQTFGIEIGDGVTPIAPGYKGMYIGLFTGTVTGWYAVTVDPNMTPGSIRVNVLKTPFDDFPQPAGTPCGGGSLSGHKGYGDAADWANKSVRIGDVFIFDVPEVSGVTKVLFQVEAVQA